MNTIDKIMKEYFGDGLHGTPKETLRRILEKHLPKEEVAEECTTCYGKGFYTVYEGDKIGCADFIGDKNILIEKGGIKRYACPKCGIKETEELIKSEPKKIKKLNITNDKYRDEDVENKINEIILWINNH